MPNNKSGETQVYNPKTNRYVKKGSDGKFVDVNSTPNKKFSGVVEEN